MSNQGADAAILGVIEDAAVGNIVRDISVEWLDHRAFLTDLRRFGFDVVEIDKVREQGRIINELLEQNRSLRRRVADLNRIAQGEHTVREDRKLSRIAAAAGTKSTPKIIPLIKLGRAVDAAFVDADDSDKVLVGSRDQPRLRQGVRCGLEPDRH